MKILVTCGPVWSPIDKVRVITNIFGGGLGFEIAKYASNRDHQVTLLIGNGKICRHDLNTLKSVKVIRFRYYRDLLRIMKTQLRNNSYDAVIHAAAVSDYEPIKRHQGKIKSGRAQLVLKLKPTIKIVNIIRKIQPNTILVKFKLEVNKSNTSLIKIAKKSMVESGADFIVANDYSHVHNKYHVAYIISESRAPLKLLGKYNIARNIITTVEKRFEENARELI